MSFVTTSAKIKTILETLEGAGGGLNEVFGYFEFAPQKFPCAMVRMLGASREERLDTDNNLLTMAFVVRVLFRSDNDAANETLKETIIDQVLDKLRTSDNVDTLDGVVEKFSIESVEPIESSEGDPLTGFDVIVSCAKIKAIG